MGIVRKVEHRGRSGGVTYWRFGRESFVLHGKKTVLKHDIAYFALQLYKELAQFQENDYPICTKRTYLKALSTVEERFANYSNRPQKLEQLLESVYWSSPFYLKARHNVLMTACQKRLMTLKDPFHSSDRLIQKQFPTNLDG